MTLERNIELLHRSIHRMLRALKLSKEDCVPFLQTEVQWHLKLSKMLWQKVTSGQETNLEDNDDTE